MGSTALPPPRLRLRARDPAAAGEVFELREPPRKRGRQRRVARGESTAPPRDETKATHGHFEAAPPRRLRLPCAVSRRSSGIFWG